MCEPENATSSRPGYGAASLSNFNRDTKQAHQRVFGLSILIEFWVFLGFALGSNLVIANQGISQVERGMKVCSYVIRRPPFSLRES